MKCLNANKPLSQYESHLFLILLVARLESHLFRRTKSEPHNCVYYNQIDINVEHFTWAELADTHLAYGAAHGNGRKAQRIYHELFPNSVQIIVRCLCRPSPMGNWYICTEQSQHRMRAIILHAAIWWGCFATFWCQPLHKHRRSCSRRRCWLSSCVEGCARVAASSYPSAEGADTVLQKLP